MANRQRFECSPDGGKTILSAYRAAMPDGGVVLTYTDISERKRGELALHRANTELEQRIEERTLALRTSESRFRDLAESASDWYWETDAELRFTFISESFYRVTGLSPEQVIGHQRWELASADVLAANPDGWRRHRADMEAHRQFRNFEYPITTVDDDVVTIRITGKPCFDGAGQFVGYRGTGSDATLLVQAQAELLRSEKLAGLGGMVAGVAHEINTPVGSSLTAASFLLERTQQFEVLYRAGQARRSDMDGFLETCHQGASSLVTNLHRAAELVRSFKQVAVDQSSEKSRRVNLREYLDEILLSLHPRLKRTRHRVSIDVPDDLSLYCDPGALSQVITNLAINSLVHGFEQIDDGRIEIAARIADRPREVLLTYSDNGCGMVAEAASRMFEPFFTTRRGQGGSGLGMYLVYNLVTQNLRGRIDYQTAPGQGVRFTLHIPLGEERDDTIARAAHD